MSSVAEDILFANLTDVEALDVLAAEGLPLDCIPTESVRPVVEWVIDYYFQTGRKKAPSAEIITENWGKVLEDAEITLGDGTEPDSIESAIETLKGQKVHFEFQTFLRRAGTVMATAPTPEKVDTLQELASELFAMALGMQSAAGHVEAATGFEVAALRYDERATLGHVHSGMAFGFDRHVPDRIDGHTYYIHPGELAMLAAPPKFGKSISAAYIANHEYQRGETVVLFTLENSVDMTWDRITCSSLGIDPRRFQRGQCNESEIIRIQEHLRLLKSGGYPGRGRLHVIQPPIGSRSIESMVKMAQSLDATILILDQLTFVEPPDPRAPRHEQIRDMLHLLKSMISGTHWKVPCLVLHQINREGQKAAERLGRLEMYHLAEGSEAERTCDWVFGLYQSAEDRLVDRTLFQTLAARREELRAWSLLWRPFTGNINVLGEVTFSAN